MSTDRDLGHQFIVALGRLETARDVEPLVALFAEDCELSNAVTPEPFRGHEGIRRFWQEYRNLFGDVHSDFRRFAASDSCVMLEWSSEGTAREGHRVRYEGVTVLEIEGGLIRCFRAYFDPTQLGLSLEGPRRAERGNAVAAARPH